MGIKNLGKLIKEHTDKAIVIENLSKFSNKVAVIDVSIYMYRFMYKVKTSGIGSPIEGFVRQVIKLSQYRITPCYVFDGKPPKEKKDTLVDRAEKKAANKSKIAELKVAKSKLAVTEDSPVTTACGRSFSTECEVDVELEKLNKRVLDVNRGHFEKLQVLLTLMGVPYIIADGEAEGLCARLVRENYADFAISEDSDLYPCACPISVKGFTPDKNQVTVCYLDVLLKEFDVTYKQFVDICILCGCDYLHKKTIRGIGQKRAFDFIKEHGTIEKMIENVCNKDGKFSVSEHFDYTMARSLFFHSGMETNLEGLTIQMNIPVIDKMIEFINRECPVHPKYISYLIESYSNTVKRMIMERGCVESSTESKKKLSDYFTTKTV